MPYSQRDKKPYDRDHTENILSVSSLNSMARSLLESNFPAVIVEGEISNLAVPSSGHWYLTLKDKSSQIRCAMFVNRNRMVLFKPENGKQIIVRGRLSIYEGRGDYQLILDGMEEAGDGALQRAFEQLKRKLHDEGLFADENKQEMQNHYQHIGVITSATGAAVQDILSVFARRFPATRITLLPAVVQGAGAADEIVRAIERANTLAEKLGLQALIVGRGGGSLEDLQAFNEERLARAIFASELPICSAVGHEVDFTIADFVADLRAPTPSAAAEQLSPNQEDYFELLLSTSAQFKSAISLAIKQGRQQLTWIAKQLKHPDRRLQEQTQNLDRLDIRLRRAMSSNIATQRIELTQMQRTLSANSPKQLLERNKIRLAAGRGRLDQSLRSVLASHRSSLQTLSRSLNSVSPLSTLARGYSITVDSSSKVIRSTDDVKVGATITSRLGAGEIVSTVSAVAKK
ncbi:MAG: exodeoxyribonuclease VII large subunit [Gammaproteobacteria bacterium]|nr:exodeoxyribonuclease VII large subunit [Gammaproteobacteria bacterium]